MGRSPLPAICSCGTTGSPAVGTVPPDATAERVIDGRHRLVMPGLINGHLHSSEALFKGRYDNLPLELWMLYSYPILGTSALAERLIYLRTMLVAIKSLKNGVTCVTDDVFEAPRQDLDRLGAVFDAYADSGLRATVSGHVIDRNFLDAIPFTDRFVPAALRERIAANPMPSAQDYLAFSRAAFQTFHNRLGRLRYMVAPSAPQRCTPELMQAADELARQHRVPFHTHIVETKVQAVTGPALYGKTLVRYMHDLGLLHSGITIAHSIWVTDEDIELMGEAGMSIVHNVISNQKLGAGIAPDPQAAQGRRHRYPRLRRHLQQRYAPHVRRHARRGPAAQHLDAGLPPLAERGRGPAGGDHRRRPQRAARGRDRQP